MTDDAPRSALAARQQRLFGEQEEAVRALVAKATEAALGDLREEARGGVMRVREALGDLREAQVMLDRLGDAQVALSASERRLRRLRRSVWLGATVAALLILSAALGGLWVGAWQVAEGRAAAARLVAQAGGAAEAIRAVGAGEIATVRAQTHQAVEAARLEAQDHQAEALADLDVVGTQLAAALGERDAVRAELERFIALRERVGFTMAEHWNGAPVIIVPEGKKIRPWGAPGLFDLAHFNGQMYRVVDER